MNSAGIFSDGDWADEQTGARFFKIILHSTVLDKKLLVPRKFVRDSAGGLLHSKSTTLKLPSGDEWEVELIKKGEDVWFGSSGWQRFAEFYTLGYGHFLVFEYTGRGEFSVVIFGRSATEINYPVREAIGIEDSAVSVEILDGDVDDDEMDAAATNKLKENSKGKSPMANDGGNGKAGEAGTIQMKREQKSCWKSIAEFDNPMEEKQGSCSKSSKSGALQLDGFPSKRPSFQIKMSQSYMAGAKPHIPLPFRQKHIKLTEQRLKLEAGGRDWTVELYAYRTKHMKLGLGWNCFMEDNSLQLGDVCNFELVSGDPTDVQLKVTIARACA
ncbi:unnamed protein product [Linum trigynum]|uniref:TF-B3 domain-containing protein n=1 Tax=Linum trigynum TaxID=586398 RepID=A0AAV2G1M5_9ROSI